MNQNQSISYLQNFVGKKVEIIAFGISYLGIIEEVDYDAGTIKLVDDDEFAILEIERVESFAPAS